MHGGESSTFLNRWQTQKGPPINNNNVRVHYAVYVHTKSKFTIDKYLFLERCREYYQYRVRA